MVCNSCGRQVQNEGANFCEYCGDDLRKMARTDTSPDYSYSGQYEAGNASAPVTSPMSSGDADNQTEKPVSFLNWLGTYLIMFIPFVGGLVFLVMLIVWSTGKNVSESKKNWARASLVFYLIIILLIILFIFMFAFMLRDPQFREIWNNEMNQYNDIFKDYR